LVEMLHRDLDHDPMNRLRLRLLNLSRTAGENAFDAVVEEILNHEGWGSCEGCPGTEGNNPCPIVLNRKILLGDSTEYGAGNFRKRLRDTLLIAAANDEHVPIRQLLTLTVNILLGNRGGTDPLLTCKKAKSRAREQAFAQTNPYENALGLNLRPSTRERYAVFSILERFGIGHETNNAIDELLIDGRPGDLRDQVFNVDPIYGSLLFEQARHAYVNGEALVAKDFGDKLAAQRRRLFFRLGDKPRAGALSPWGLTILHYAGEYLRFCVMLHENASTEELMRQLVKGLNRALTGMMTEDADRLWLATGVGRGEAAMAGITTLPPVSRGGVDPFQIGVEMNAVTRRPAIVVRSAISQFEATPPELDLKPLVFEYLLRVANGSLPFSFSRQCHQEIRHFALNATAHILQILGEQTSSQVSVLSVESDGAIKSRTIRA
jgi:hypothetical protein